MSPARRLPMLDVDALLDDPITRVVVCCGSGGVGKTTTSAALALRAAERGRRAVVITIDPARRLAQAMGLPALGNEPGRAAAVTGPGAVGQPAAVAELFAAAADPAAMTHAWLFTGPPGSGRSVAARAFAAALQCPEQECGQCPACRTVMAGTHADVREIVPEGLSISVKSMRILVESSARRPSTGPFQILIIQNADSLGERAGNALLKSSRNRRTRRSSCSAPRRSIRTTSRSRSAPAAGPSDCEQLSASAVADVLVRRDGIDAEAARWVASVGGGHVGRARRLARDPEARARRTAVLGLPVRIRSIGDAFAHADDLVRRAKAEAAGLSETRDATEREEREVAMGAGGVGKGVAAAARSAKAAGRELERQQKSRNTRNQRNAIDRALVDLAGFLRDVLVTGSGAAVAPAKPDRSDDIGRTTAEWTPESTLRRLETVLACRTALEQNVKPEIAVEAMMVGLLRG